MSISYSEFVSVSNLNNMTVKELRSICANYGLTRYSKANKNLLLDMIHDFYVETLEAMTSNDLKKIASDLGYTGISKTNKANLIELIINHDEDVVDIDDDIDISSDSDNNTDGLIETVDNPENTNSDEVKIVFRTKIRFVKPDDSKTVWDIHNELASVMGIPVKPNFTVNGNEVPNNYRPKAGDEVEFFNNQPGSKG